MNWFEYKTPTVRELKEIGYGIPIKLSDDDIVVSRQILNSQHSAVSQFTEPLNKWHYRDSLLPAIRIYAYYINNPAQFAHDPVHIQPAMLSVMLRAAASFLVHIYGIDIGGKPKLTKPLVKTYSNRLTSSTFEVANKLAKDVRTKREIEESFADDFDIGRQIANIKFQSI